MQLASEIVIGIGALVLGFALVWFGMPNRIGRRAAAEMEQHGRFQQTPALARSTARWPSTAGSAVLLHGT
jgi:hypothetical protein